MTTPTGSLRVDDLADVRAGDKGDTLILAVIPRDREGYALLERRLTGAAVAEHFGLAAELGDGLEVERTLLPHLPAIVLRVPQVLGGGVTGYTGLDGHGKTLSYHLLAMALPGDPG